MCRIAGIWQHNHKSINNIENTVIQMRDALSYGGPDAAGVYVEGNLGLGHRRLSILDLSDAGTQPIHWEHYCIIYNGEIYNFHEIRQELELKGYKFTSNTDTEVILKGFHEWGYEVVKKFRGMFAFALWDKKEQKLMLCRDRVGVKPLYWYLKDGLFMFASELKSFHEHPDFDKTINKDAVSLFLQQGYIPSPYCIFQYAQKVQPGTWLEISTPLPIGSGQVRIKTIPYWNVNEAYQPLPNNISKNEDALVEELEPLLAESFQLRMVADVPVGMFLSGGIDSSLVTALLQKQSNQQLKTFTIGFQDKNHNEAEFAKQVAQHIGTDHYDLYCTEKDFIETIPLLPQFYDEPFGDSSAIPTYLVSKLARENVTVSLSADGGDEIFGGYTKYEMTQKVFQKMEAYPSFMRRSAAALLSPIDPSVIETYGNKLPFLKNYAGLGNKFHKLKNALSSTDLTDFFNNSSVYFTKKEQLALYPHFKERFSTTLNPIEGRTIGFLSLIDIQTYLEGDIMTKVDRATMQVALEGREPFLDHKVVEFGLKLPDNMKIQGNSTKHLLRKILYKHVPKALIERPKMGFSIPIEQWLRTYLQEDLQALTQDKKFIDAFGLKQNTLSTIVRHFIAKTQYVNPHSVWFIYVLYKWYQKWL
jgi:asparagine synthase (glutamine-hydrolysing)